MRIKINDFNADFDETRERDDSDFNDLLRLSGVDQVKKSIEKVYSPEELEASLIQKLKQVLRQVKKGTEASFCRERCYSCLETP